MPGRGALLLVVFCCWAVVGTAAYSAENAKPSAKPLNILILLSDDHNFRTLGCAGDPVVKTPNLDALAKQGVRFTHCFTPMPQCSPSRAAILTGQDSWTNGVGTGGKAFKPDSPLWPTLLDQAGYQMFYTGKWHNHGMPWDHGFNTGAAVFVGGMADHRKVPVIQWKESKEQERPAEKFSSTTFADAAVKFLKERDAAKPFCAYVSFTAPHDPWVPPGEFAAIYNPAEMPLPKNFMARPPFKVPAGFAKLRDQAVLPYPRTEADVRRAMVKYYGMVTQLDEQIGRVLQALEDSGQRENTLVIFAGDHGYSLGSHGFVGKQCMYEEGIRTPLIVYDPRLKRAAPTCDKLVSLVDFYPTICEAAGVAVPPKVEGKSLLELYAGTADEAGEKWRKEIFASHHSPEKHGMSTCCIRTERYKLIQHLTTGEVEFFDLAADPWELNNLTGGVATENIEKVLDAQLIKWRAMGMDRAGAEKKRSAE